MPTRELILNQPTAISPALEQAIDQVASPDSSFSEDINHLAGRTRELAKAMIAYGDACAVGEGEDFENLDCRITHFVWAERAKHFLVLYRNVQFQLQTAAIMVNDGQSAQGTVGKLHEKSKIILREALGEWENEVAATKKQLESNPKLRQKQLSAWKLQHNPWPEYRAQLAEISNQAESLAEEFVLLSDELKHFETLRKHIGGCATTAREIINNSEAKATAVAAYVAGDGEKEAPGPGKIATRLEEYLADNALQPLIHQFTNEITTTIAKITERTRVTVAADHGMLRFKEVNFRRATDQWVSAEVLPQLYELWELSEKISGGLNVTISNVRNRAVLCANELKAGNESNYDPEQMSQPFVGFLERTETTKAVFAEIADRLDRLVEADLRLTSVYRDVPGFLPLPMQLGFSELTRRQDRWVAPVREWLGSTFAGLEQWRGDAAREEKMSVSEKIVRAINQRKPQEVNAAYTNILMTKGYIGESFLVGRDDETEHLRSLIANWRAGYRGAVMLTGRRLSGKTLFGELVANRLFPNKVIRLVPNGTINVDGRRMTTSGNLAEALVFVQKHTIQNKPMVWIDDLELWWDNETSLAANVEALADHIDSYSTRIFYLVATSQSVYNHLDRFMGLDRIFQANVNLDDFSLEEMQRAVRIRHGATHKLLVNQDGEPFTDTAFNRRVRRFYRYSQGNVGDTLNRWAWLTEYCDEDRVNPTSERLYRLPSFLNTDTGILLTTIFLERRTNEYHLRQLLGPAFETRYRAVLQRLLRVGMLTRQNDGWLEIRESVVNDVGRALENNGYLKNEL